MALVGRQGPNWEQRCLSPDHPDVANGIYAAPQRWASFLSRARQTLTLTGMANWVYAVFYALWDFNDPADMHMSAADLAARFNGPPNPDMMAEDPSFVAIYFGEANHWLNGGPPYQKQPWDSFGVNDAFYAVDMCNFNLDDAQQHLP